MVESSPGPQLTETAPAAALVMALGDPAAVEQFLIDRHGLPLPPVGQRIERPGRSILFVAPGKLLVLDHHVSDGFVASLTEGLQGIAAVTDQSDGLRTFRISGKSATERLQKCVAVDLHPARFPRGSAMATMIGLMRVHLSRIDDEPTYELSVARSLADNLITHIGNEA